MSILLETLGRGLPGRLRRVFAAWLPPQEDSSRRTAPLLPDATEEADAQLRRGIRELDRLHLTAARIAFARATQLAPQALPPVVGLACVYDECGRFDLVRPLLSAACRQHPDDPSLLFALGLSAERDGDRAAAAALYHAALQRDPLRRGPRERLAALAVRGGDWNRAIEHYGALTRLDPGQIATRTLLGCLHVQADMPLKAIEEFQQALLIEPEILDDDPPGDQLDPAGIQAELQKLERVVRKYPGVAAFHLRLGELYARIDEDAAALAAYHDAQRLQPNSLETTVRLGSQYLRCGEPAAAAQTFVRAVEINDRLIAAFVGLGVAQFRAGRAHEAEASFDLAGSLEPSTTLLFAEAARLQIRSERRPRRGRRRKRSGGGLKVARRDPIQEALRRHGQAAILQPMNAEVHLRRGLLLRHAGCGPAAQSALARAIEVHPLHAGALLELGVCLREINEPAAALTCFERALQAPVDQLALYYELALLFGERSQDAAAAYAEQFGASSARRVFPAVYSQALVSLGLVERSAALWRHLLNLRPWAPSSAAPRRLSETQDASDRENPGPAATGG